MLLIIYDLKKALPPLENSTYMSCSTLGLDDVLLHYRLDAQLIQQELKDEKVKFVAA